MKSKKHRISRYICIISYPEYAICEFLTQVQKLPCEINEFDLNDSKELFSASL